MHFERLAEILKYIHLAPSSGKNGQYLLSFWPITVPTRALLKPLLHVEQVPCAHTKCLKKLCSNQSDSFKQSDASKTAKESLSRLSRYLYISIYTQVPILISRLSFFFTHCVTHQISVFSVPSFTWGRLRFAVCCKPKLLPEAPDKHTVNQSHTTILIPPHHVPPSHPSAITRPRRRRAHFHGRGCPPAAYLPPAFNLFPHYSQWEAHSRVWPCVCL